jgi:hypothetical protein
MLTGFGQKPKISGFASNARTAAKLEKFSVLAYPSSFGQKRTICAFGDNPKFLENAAPNAADTMASGNVAAKPRRSQGVCLTPKHVFQPLTGQRRAIILSTRTRSKGNHP